MKPEPPSLEANVQTTMQPSGPGVISICVEDASGVASLRQHQACVGGEAVRPKRDPLWLTCSDVASLRQHQACVGGEAVRPERDPLCLTCSDVASLRQHQACVGGEAGKRSSLA